jgi:hypothetical protein
VVIVTARRQKLDHQGTAFFKRFQLIEPFSSFFFRSLENETQVIFFGNKPKSPAMPDQTTCSAPTGEASQDDTALIDRARVVYQTLLYREQAARYGAAANSLLNAITQAQSGTPEALDLLLRELTSHESLIRNCPTPDEQLLSHPIPATAVLVPSIIRASNNDLATPEITAHSFAVQNIATQQTAAQPTMAMQTATSSNELTNNSDAKNNSANEIASNIPNANIRTTNQVAAEGVSPKEPSTKETTHAEPLISKPTEKPTDKHTDKTTNKPPEKALAKPVAKDQEKTKKTGEVAKPMLVKQPALAKQPVPKNPPPKELRPKQQTQKQPALKRRKVKVPIDFLASVGVHGIFLVILGAWYITVVMPTPTLSVVAGTVETQDVLIETPMESLSELETSAQEVTSIPTPQVSDVAMADAGAMQLELSVEAGVEVGGVMGEAVRELASASAPGNRVVEGAEFFGAKATGNTFIYTVDASPSMRRDRAFDAAKEQIMQSLRSMKPKQRFSILFFGGAVQKLEMSPGETLAGPVSATPENIEKAMHWLQNTQIQSDGRVPVDAVREAMEMDPDGIFLLFDGDTKLDNWVHSIKELNRSDGFLSDGAPAVPIHVIHFFREEFQRTMQLLAMENRGTYRFIPRPNVGQTLSR